MMQSSLGTARKKEKNISSNTKSDDRVNNDTLHKVNNRTTTTSTDFVLPQCSNHASKYHPLLIATNNSNLGSRNFIPSSPTGVVDHMIYDKCLMIPDMHLQNGLYERKYNNNSDGSDLTNKIDNGKKSDINYPNDSNTNNIFEEKNCSSYSNRIFKNSLLSSPPPAGMAGDNNESFRNSINDCNHQNSHYYVTDDNNKSKKDKNINSNLIQQGMALTSDYWRRSKREDNIVANPALIKIFQNKKKKMEEEEERSAPSESKHNLNYSTKSNDKTEMRESLQEEYDYEDEEIQLVSHSRPQIIIQEQEQEPRDTTSGTEFIFLGSEPKFKFCMEEEEERWNTSQAGNDNRKLQPPRSSTFDTSATISPKQDDTSSSHYIQNTTSPIVGGSGITDVKRKPLAEVLLWTQQQELQKQKNNQVRLEEPTINPWEEQHKRPSEDASVDYDNQQQQQQQWQMYAPPISIEDGRVSVYTIQQDAQQQSVYQGYSSAPQTIQEYQPYQHHARTNIQPSQQHQHQHQHHYIQPPSPYNDGAISPIRYQRRTISPHNLNRTNAIPSSPHARYNTQHTATFASGPSNSTHQQQQSPSRFFHTQQQHVTAGSSNSSRSTTPHRQYSQASSSTSTPPPSTIREGSSSNPNTPTNTTSMSNRSPPDILKTLLRKKACLYEPETSQAIALITWLVGRHLALSHGYFSRQQLQAGVHHVVQSNISSNVITRTKVNRCMQIILNCCFHYIIPRPDGVEDSGKVFRHKFSSFAVDDSYKVLDLPYPWNDIDVNALLQSWNSNIITSSLKDDSEEQYQQQPAKRNVLLCFNENVKSSDDVYHCHKDFIRDAANTANLHLTANEWKQFFADGSGSSNTVMPDTTSCASSTTTTTATCYSPSTSIVTTPPLHGSCAQSSSSSPLSSTQFALPVSWQQHHHLQQSLSPSAITINQESIIESNTTTTDYYGRMPYEELCDFRTSWCAKRYDHDSLLCGFAHTEVNRGWLRRDPILYSYEDKLCDNIIPLVGFTTLNNKEQNTYYYLNACPLGKLCLFAHSQEEIDYHPNQYKTHICSPNTGGSTTAHSKPAWKSSSSSKTSTTCQLRDICPNHHPYRQSQSQQHYYQEGRQSHSRYTHHYHHHHHYGDYHSSSSSPQHHQTISKPLPIAPMIYISPAPISDFDKSLVLPGLRTLFRQRSSTIYSCLCSSSSSRNDSNAQQIQEKQINLSYALFDNVSGNTNGTTRI